MNIQIYEEASEWFVKHRESGLDVHEKRSFDAWLRESPQHMSAYLEVSSVWEDLPSLDPSWNPTAAELIARARADDNIVSLTAPSHPAEPAPSRKEAGGTSGHALDESMQVDSGQHAIPFVAETNTQLPAGCDRKKIRSGGANRYTGLPYALAASILIAIVSGWFYLQRGVYATDIREQRSLALADGSTVELNSRSRIKIQYTEHERRIDLLEGQALFHVAKNQARPFIVRTGNTQVRAVGTAFDVYKRSSGTVVTVISGRVAVHAQRFKGGVSRSPDDDGDSPYGAGGHAGPLEPHSGIEGEYSPSSESVSSGSQVQPRPKQQFRRNVGGASAAGLSDIQTVAGEVFLAAGEQLVVMPAIMTSPQRADIAAVTAWTRRSLVFNSTSLADVAQEFNRYNTRQLVIADPQLADFRVSGVFSSVEPGLLLRFLETQPELIVEKTETEIYIRRK